MRNYAAENFKFDKFSVGKFEDFILNYFLSEKSELVSKYAELFFQNATKFHFFLEYKKNSFQKSLQYETFLELCKFLESKNLYE